MSLEKICSSCKTNQPLCCFYNKKNSKDGKENQCQSCRLNRMKYIKSNRAFTKIPAYKYCPKCDQIRSFKDFYKNKTSATGLSDYCKHCSSFIDYKRNNTLHRKDYKKTYIQNIRINNAEQWNKFFQNYYGSPICGICSKQLEWQSSNIKDIPAFDHRHNNTEIIKGSPAHWYKEHKLTEENKEIWLSCDFGILCNKCNIMLPTNNRQEWINNLLKYNGVL